MTDSELLQRFADTGDEDAFAALVGRHVDLVFRIARRRLGEETAAREVCQDVFCAVARKARQLAGHETFRAWLFRATIYQSIHYQRAQARRQRREQNITAYLDLMNELNQAPGDRLSDKALCAIDRSVDALGAKDREFVLRRFYNGESHKQIAEHFGISENASQKRLARIVRKLERTMARRGVVISATVLAASLAGAGLEAAPSGTVATVVKHALAGSTKGAGVTSSIAGLWWSTQIKAALLAGVAGFCLPVSVSWFAERETAGTKTSRTSSTVMTVSREPLANDPLFRGTLDPAEQMRRILELENPSQREAEIRFLVGCLEKAELSRALQVLADRVPEDKDHLKAFINGWARKDPKAAVAFIETRATEHQNEYVESLLSGWVKTNPSASWLFVIDQEDPRKASEMLDFWAKEMSLHDPLRALAKLESRPELARPHHFEQLFINWPNDRIGEALAAIAGIEDHRHAERAIRGFSSSSAVELTTSLWEEAHRVLPRKVMAGIEEEWLARWLIEDTDAVIDHLRLLLDAGTHKDLIKKAFDLPFFRHHQKAIEFFTEVDPNLADAQLPRLFRDWLIFDEMGALEEFGALSTAQQELVAHHVGEWMAQRAPKALYDRGMSLESSDAQVAFFDAAIEKLTEVDSAGALSLVDRLRGSASAEASLPAIAKVYAEEDPAAALSWTLETAPASDREQMVGSVLKTWARNDQPAVAMAWKQWLDEPGLRDAGAAAISEGLRDQPEAAVAWALVIEDPARRGVALAESVDQWANANAPAFMAWFNEQPESLKAELQEKQPDWVYLTQPVE